MKRGPPTPDLPDATPTKLVLPLDQTLVRRGQSLIADALAERGLQLSLETPETAKSLRRVCSTDLKRLETLVFELFIEDQADDLRLLSLREQATGATVGFIFWRILTAIEMQAWLKSFHHPNNAVGELIAQMSALSLSPGGNHMLQSADKHPVVSPPTGISLYKQPDSDGWIKIELVCVDPRQRQRQLGSLLLAATLTFAAVQENKSHAVLQVAGGSKNEAALALYDKFGFRRADDHFNPPNANLYALWDIREALAALNWEGFLLTSSATTTARPSSGSASALTETKEIKSHKK